jgi:hypothetical protein
MDAKLPESFHRIVGELPECGRLATEPYPYETVRPARTGYVERAGVKVWYAVWGESGPWLAFAPIFQIVHTQALKTTVPYLSHHFRVVTMDSRGNGRSDRPEGQGAYTFDSYSTRSSTAGCKNAGTMLAVIPPLRRDAPATAPASSGARLVARVPSPAACAGLWIDRHASGTGRSAL